jgi:HAD superfamily hydrolase (TIGR01509 family)
MKYKGFIFDMNGTMIDDMNYHTETWQKILNEDLGANMSWDEVKKHMYGKNEEVLVRVFGAERFTMPEMETWSLEKEKRYQLIFRPHLKLIAGLHTFLEKTAKKDIAIGIGTAAIPFNVDFVLDNLGIRSYFKSIITANDVLKSKPNPEVFTKCADNLGVKYAECVVFEDSPKGVEAALNAGMQAVVILTYHTKAEFEHLNNILYFVDDYSDLQLDGLF